MDNGLVGMSDTNCEYFFHRYRVCVSCVWTCCNMVMGVDVANFVKKRDWNMVNLRWLGLAFVLFSVEQKIRKSK